MQRLPRPADIASDRQGIEACFGKVCQQCAEGKVSHEPDNLNVCYTCETGKYANQERTGCLCMNGYVKQDSNV